MGARMSGYAISFLVHGLIVAAVMIVPFHHVGNRGPISLDFDVSVRGRSDLPAGHSRQDGAVRIGKKGDAPRVLTPNTGSAGQGGERGDSQMANNGQAYTEPQGPAEASGTGFAHRGAPSGQSGTGQLDIKTLNYSLPGGVDERHFSFIRETIMKGITYPDRARRMGWEGKVVLSFMVHENGSIDDIKVVATSGFSILDENARSTVARTSFKKMPVRLHVLLPVEYRLSPEK